MTEEKTELLQKMHLKQVRFAWDRYADKESIVPKFQEFQKQTGWGYDKPTDFPLL